MTLDEFLRSFGSALSEGTPLAYGIALAAGLISSAVCPCTVPVGLGVAGVAGASEARLKNSGLTVAGAFFAGVVINLTLLGAVAGRLGAVLTETFGRYWALGMAAVSLVAAAAALYAPRLKSSDLSRLRKPGLAGAFGYGFIFSLGTSPASLLLLLTVSAAQASPSSGFFLALAFGLGRGLPFLLAGLFAGLIFRLTKLRAWERGIRLASAAALLFVSVYYARAFLRLL